MGRPHSGMILSLCGLIFSIRASTAATVTGYSPQLIAIAGETRVTIKGSGFSDERNPECRMLCEDSLGDSITSEASTNSDGTEVVCVFDTELKQSEGFSCIRDFDGTNQGDTSPIVLQYNDESVGAPVAASGLDGASNNAYLFDASEYDSVALTSDPAGGAVNSDTEVKLTAAGTIVWPESKDAKCLVNRPSGTTLVYDATFESSTDGYSCDFSSISADIDNIAVEESVTYHLSMSRNQAEIVAADSVSTFNFVIPAPEVANIAAIGGGTVLLATWDYPVMTDSSSLPTDCNEIFADTTLFGTNPVCSWPTNQHVEINLGTSSTLILGTSSAAVKADTFYRTQKRYTPNLKATSKTTIVQGEQTPTVTVVGPSVLYFCSDRTGFVGYNNDDFVFQPVVEGVVGPNILEYTWSIDGTQVHSDNNFGIHDLVAQASGQKTLLLSVDHALSGSVLEFTTTFDIKSHSESDQSGHFESGQTIKIERRSAAHLRAIIPSAGDCPNAFGEYKVVLVDASDDSVIVSEAVGTELYVDGYTLDSGTAYTAKCIEATTGVTVATSDVTVVDVDIVASIRGGSKRLVPLTPSPKLTAAWPDPNTIEAGAPAGHATYDWTCTSSNCNGVGLQKTDNSVLITSLNVGVYEITLTVTVGGSSASTTTIVEVQDGALASEVGATLGIYLQSPTVEAGSDIVLAAAFAQATSSLDENVVFSWSTVAADGASTPLDLSSVSDTTEGTTESVNLDGITEAFAQTLVINGDAADLKVGRRYLFKASATRDGSTSSYAEFDVNLPYPPGNAFAAQEGSDDASSRVTVSLDSGKACHDPFVISAHGYRSKHTITYEFAMKYAGTSTPISIHVSQASSTSTGVFLPVGIAHVGVRARDVNGVTEWSWTKINNVLPVETSVYDGILSALPDFSNSASLDTDYQLLIAVAMDLAASGTIEHQELAMSKLAAAATTIAALEPTSYRRYFSVQGVVALTEFAKSNRESSIAIQEKASVALAFYAEAFVPGLSTLQDFERVLVALEAVATLDEIGDVTTANTNQDWLNNVGRIVGAVRGSICSTVEYGQPSYSYGSNGDLVQLQMMRQKSDVIEIADGTNGKITIQLPSDVESDVSRGESCFQDLTNGDKENSATSCAGGCILLMETSGDILSQLGVVEPIPSTISSSAATLTIEPSAARRRLQRRETNSLVVDFVLPSDECDNESCECREWDTSTAMWVKTAADGVFSQNDASCTTTYASGSSINRVAVFKSCTPGYLGRRCQTVCPDGKWGQDCISEQDCNGMVLNPVDGVCTCTSGFTGRSCTDLCDSKAAIATVTAFSSTTMKQGYGAECDSPCTCELAGTQSCDINNGTCTCVLGYSGSTCETNIDDCMVGTADAACKNEGVCTDLVNGFSCDCGLTGFDGDTCEENYDYCTGVGAIDECMNGAACVDQKFKFTCTCPIGMTGVYCESYCPDGTWGQDCALQCTCGEQGTCHAMTGACSCNEGWIGDDCTEQPVPPDPTLTIVGSILGLLGFVLIIVGVKHCLKRSERKKQEKQKSDLNAAMASFAFNPNGSSSASSPAATAPAAGGAAKVSPTPEVP